MSKIEKQLLQLTHENNLDWQHAITSIEAVIDRYGYEEIADMVLEQQALQDVYGDTHEGFRAMLVSVALTKAVQEIWERDNMEEEFNE